jgi:Tfp pilus assembly protein PilE
MRVRQRGVTLFGLLFASIVVAVAALLAIKVIPEYVEYWQLKKIVKAVASETSGDASARQLRIAFEKHATVNSITSITGEDLDIGKQSGQFIVSFAYEKRIPLFANVTLLMTFRGNSKE